METRPIVINIKEKCIILNMTSINIVNLMQQKSFEPHVLSDILSFN